MEHHCYIDGSNFIHRAWHVADPRHRRVDGLDLGATHLFARMLMKLVEKMNSGRRPPSHIAIFFDPGRAMTWRSEVFPSYKSNRPPTPEGLSAQIPFMQKVSEVIGIRGAVCDGFEADDLIAKYTIDARNNGDFVTVVSGDKDMMQLVSDKSFQYDAKSDAWFKKADVEEKFGVPSHLVGDFLAMAGDAADAIPGVRGIGPVYAAKLLNKYGSLMAMVDNPSMIEEAKLREKIESNIDEARISYRLTVLTGEGVPTPLDLADMKRLPDVGMRDRVEAWLKSQMGQA